MSDDEVALIRTICEYPEEDTPRLAYADYLDENAETAGPPGGPPDAPSRRERPGWNRGRAEGRRAGANGGDLRRTGGTHPPRRPHARLPRPARFTRHGPAARQPPVAHPRRARPRHPRRDPADGVTPAGPPRRAGHPERE